MTARVAYLAGRFPKRSETFVADEIEALERQGLEIELHTLLPARDRTGAPGTAREPLPAGPPSPRWALAQLYWLVRAPRGLLGAWIVVLSRHRRAPRDAARAVFAVGAGAVIALRLRRRPVRHLHAHFATHPALAAWVVHRLTGVPYSFTAHADDVFVRRPMLAEKVRDAAFVVTVSEFNRRFLAEELGETACARVRVLHCGVATDRFAARHPVRRHADAPFTILCVGRLEQKKGQRVLLDACGLLAERGVAFRCLVVGEGREREALERRLAALGLGGRVRLVGAQPRERIRELLDATDVFVLPSVVAPSGRAEGIPVALMEAMAMERPVVSTRTSGIPELVEDGRSGVLVEPGDAEALARALLALRDDPERAARIGRAARAVVRERFDLDRNAGRLRRLFAEGEASGRAVPVAGHLGAAAGLGGAGR